MFGEFTAQQENDEKENKKVKQTEEYIDVDFEDDQQKDESFLMGSENND